MGAWFEARILKIMPAATKPNGEVPSSSSSQDFDPPPYLYRVAYDGYGFAVCESLLYIF